MYPFPFAILPDSIAIRRRKCGLKFATAADGASEWVLPEDVARFKEKGKALLGKENKVIKAEESAREMALSHVKTEMDKEQRRIGDETKEDSRTGWPELVNRNDLQAMHEDLLKKISEENQALLAQKSCACIIS